jgi:hypothetical protein
MRLDFFGRQQGQRVRVKSQPLQVEVGPPPADLGTRQWLPALDFELSDDWQQKLPVFVVGEPVTRTLRLKARGLQAAQLPALQLQVPDSFKIYTDQPAREDRVVAEGLEGVLEQKIAFVPTRPGLFELPAIGLPWWDMKQQRWREAQLGALQVEVAPGPQSNPPLPATAPPPLAAPDPPPASQAVDTASSSGFWPWLSLGLGLGWLLTLTGFWWSRRNPGAPPPEPVADVGLNERQARQAVIQAAACHNAHQTRVALVAWSKTLWPELSALAYEQLMQSGAAELQQELVRLDRHLYAGEGQTWNGQALARLVKSFALSDHSTKVTALPDLYP